MSQPTPMSREDALREFREAGALLENGHFILSSGLRSETYLQCARVMMDPARGARLCGALADRLGGVLAQDPRTVLCVSPAMGGVLVGYEVARHLGAPSVFVERGKTTDAFELRRGFDLAPGAACVVIEDVVTTGGSAQECADLVAELGGEVRAFACLVDRSGGQNALKAPLVSLLTVDAPTYHPDMLPDRMRARPAIKPGSRATSEIAAGLATT